jgi:hypothetical protein
MKAGEAARCQIEVVVFRVKRQGEDLFQGIEMAIGFFKG